MAKIKSRKSKQKKSSKSRGRKVLRRQTKKRVVRLRKIKPRQVVKKRKSTQKKKKLSSRQSSRKKRVVRKSIRRKPTIHRSRGGSVKRVSYEVNRDFELYEELKTLLIKASPSTFPKLIEGLKKVGKIKLAVITGIFFSLEDSRIDLLVVGENISLPKFTNVIKDMEAEAGKELRYVILGTDEFLYRYEMFDRFLRDIIDSPHQRIINKLKFT